MNWNAKPENVTLPPHYPKKQSSFLEQAFINTFNTTSHSSLNYPGSNQGACMFLRNSNPVSQPLLNMRNYTAPQQIPISDIHNGTVVASQTSVERITYANVKGSKQLNHNLQMSSGVTQNVWLNSPMKSSVLSHTGATVSHQTNFGTNTPNIHALHNQFVTSDTCSMQLQMIPSNSPRVPITYQWTPRLNPSVSERQVDWAQQYTSSGLTYPDYRPLPKQYNYNMSRSFSQDPALQKQNPMPSTSLQIKNSHPPDPPQTLQSKQTATVQSYQYAVPQTDKRPPPPPYDCRYTSQPLPSTQHVIKQTSLEVPQSPEMHLPEMRKDFSRSFQQHWQNLNENVSTVGNSCNLKVNTNVIQPFNEPVSSSVDGVQTVAQNNQERKTDSCDLTSNQVLDTSVTKEKLVRDIKTLVEIKKKFSELARKIKINKNLLMAAGCIKTTDTSFSELAQNSELSLKQTAQVQSERQVTLATPENKPTVMESVKETNTAHSTMNSSIQDPNCGNFNQVNSVLLNSVCSEKFPVPDQLHDLKVRTSLKASTVEITQTTLNHTQISSENVNVELNVPTNSETTYVPQSTSFEEYVSKYPNKNTLILSLLTCRDKPQEKLFKNASEIIQDSKPHSCEVSPNPQITGNQLNLKTMEAPSPCNTNAKIVDNSFCPEHKSSTSGMSSKSDSHFSMELLATCLSLWKKQPSEPTEEKQYNESRKNRTAVGVLKPVETCDKRPFPPVGNSQNKMVNSSQETTLSTVVQNCESSGATNTKGTELQVAVVSPLILSDVKTLPVKEITPEALSETVYPVIKEGSVCSLQNQLAENTSITAALKANADEPVARTTTGTELFSPIQKEEQNESVISEDTPNNQGKPVKSEPDTHYSVSEQQASYKPRKSDIASGDMLHIDNICSLVEGDTSYNSQIAKIFNLPPLKRVEPQKSSLPKQQVISSRQQKEHIDNVTENKDFGFQNDDILKCTDVSHKITDQAESLEPPESSLRYVEANSGILEESELEHISKKESTANEMCSLAAIQQDSCPQEVDAACSYTAQDPTRNEILNDKTSILYLHDQLSELLKEFPYGIEAVNTYEGSVAQQITNQISKDQTCDKTGCDSKDSTEQIQITILNSEQMKELFPEHEDQVCEVDKLTEHEEEEPVNKEGGQCDPQADTDGKSHDPVMDSEKDDVRCCALGWLSMVYEGVPQCQCNSVKNSTSEEKEGEEKCSPLEIDNCKQGEKTDENVPVGCDSPLNDNPKTPLTFPGTKNHFPEIEESKDINDMPKTTHHQSLTEQELSGQFLSKGDKKLDFLQSHKRKGKLKFHEITFQSSNKMTKFSQESLHQKLMAQNLRPLKPKVGFLTNKNKDMCMKNGSLVQSTSPEKIKLKAGGLRQKVLEKRKLDDGGILDSKIKRKKHDKREYNKNVGDGTFKLCNFLSIANERARVKEKTVSNAKSLGPKDTSSKISRVLTPMEYLQRQKHKEAMGSNTSKKSCVRNVTCDSQYVKSSKLSRQVGSCGKSNERHNSVQASKESLNICSSHGKNLKFHHSDESKICISRNAKGIVGGKQLDKMLIDKTRLDKSLNSINNEFEFSQMSPQSKDQRKLYLNRVAFKCTERESICLTKLDNSPMKLNKERRPENKRQRLLPVKDATEKRSMLEFKLCPDGLIKNTSSDDSRKDLQPCPSKEQAPVPVSGIKSTKEDWLRGVTEEKRMPEANQEIDNNVLANARLSKRSFSADGFETLQNPVKDSKAMFQTYKKIYMEKRSRSLGSSPLK